MVTPCFPRSDRPARPAGTTVLEALLALALIGAAGVLSAQTLATARRQHEALRQRFVARQEAANLLEKWLALPAEQIVPIAPPNGTSPTAGTSPPSPFPADATQALSPAAEALPGVAARLEVAPAEGGPTWNGWRARVEVSWRAPDGARTRPVALAAWRFTEKTP